MREAAQIARERGTTRAAAVCTWIVCATAELHRRSIRPTCCYVAVRRAGKTLFEQWFDRPFDHLEVNDVASAIVVACAERSRDAVMLELVFGYAERTLRHDERIELPREIERGLTGLAFKYGENWFRVSPTTMLLRNEGFAQTLRKLGLCAAKQLGSAATESEVEQDLIAFSTCQFATSFPRLDTADSAYPVFRGKPVVPLRDVSAATVARLASGLTDWMLQHVTVQGALTYCYHPNDDCADEPTSSVRELMGTLALFRAASFYDDLVAHTAAELSLRHNLDHYYIDEGEFGVVVDEAGIKLGAAAFAVMAIRQSSQRVEYAERERRLLRFVDAMWSPSGRFRTFLRPKRRAHSNQNFYPGEALLLWAGCWIEQRTPELWRRIETSFLFYREWHVAQRNPAFIPWHTQAYFKLWHATGDERFKNFVFEMNDWLLAFQQWDQVADFPDAQGRFYDPDKPYGPPHASSTGAYLEGLIDAFTLAKCVGDEARMERYALAIRRGLRNIMQLQFADEIELIALPNAERARGGVRTTEYESAIRIDNVQHNMMAAFKVLRERNFLWL